MAFIITGDEVDGAGKDRPLFMWCRKCKNLRVPDDRHIRVMLLGIKVWSCWACNTPLEHSNVKRTKK
jgi:hypothetical protein